MRVLIPRFIFGDIRKDGAKSGKNNERGGLLLGYRKPNALEIVTMTFPGAWDHATPTLFRRSEKGHRIKAIKEWVRSKGTVGWIGEWHTHPGGLPHPSFTDRRNWKCLSRHVGAPMAFVIVAGNRHFVGLQRNNTVSVKKLDTVEEDGEFILFGCD